MDGLEDVGVPIELHVYDLSKGLARMLSQPLLGKQLEGIWHTGLVAYGREYFFGSHGVESCRPRGTILGDPDRVLRLGETHVPYEIFFDYLVSLGDSAFSSTTYDLFRHNCNTFSDEVSTFLCGRGIPKYILDLPAEVLDTPLGQALQPFLGSGGISLRQQSDGQPNTPSAFASPPTGPTDCVKNRVGFRTDEDDHEYQRQLEQIRALSTDDLITRRRSSGNSRSDLSRKERKREKRRRKREKREELERRESLRRTGDTGTTMAEVADEASGNNTLDVEEDNDVKERKHKARKDPLAAAEEEEEEERKREQEKKRQRDPPIVFKDEIDVSQEMEQLTSKLSGRLNGEEEQSLRELRQYAVEGEGSWALGDYFLTFAGRILQDTSLPGEARVAFLRLLAALSVQRDDMILLLHQDRRDHVLMSYAVEIDRLPFAEQEALALLICNMFDNLSTSEWLLYISEWPSSGSGQGPVSNIRVTTKVAVHSLLSEQQPAMLERGSAIMYNLAAKEVKSVIFDDVATELAMAILQFFQGSPGEEQTWRCLKALLRFCRIAHAEVPPLIQMIGPDPVKFKGKLTSRVDDVIEELQNVLANPSAGALRASGLYE